MARQIAGRRRDRGADNARRIGCRSDLACFATAIIAE
jgi:hypothetical protein